MAANKAPTPLAIELVDEVASWYYKEPQRNQKGGFSNFIVRKKGDFDRICFQATAQDGEPRCVAPFGISEPYDATKEDSNKRNFELNLHSPALRTFLETLDKVTVQKAIENYDTWFGGDDKKKKKTISPDAIASMYRPLIQEGDESKGYGDMFRTKVIISGPNKVRVYVARGLDEQGQPVVAEGNLNDITKFAEVVPIIEVVGMWFMSKQYGLSLTTTDVVVFPKSRRQPGLFNFGGTVPKVVQGAPAAAADDMEIVPSEEQGRGGGSSSAPRPARQSRDDSGTDAPNALDAGEGDGAPPDEADEGLNGDETGPAPME